MPVPDTGIRGTKLGGVSMHLRKKSWGICLAVCMALTAVLCTYPRAQAAAGVNTEKTGNLTLALGAEDSDQMARDMARIEEPLQIHVWKLADMTEVGTYDFREAFQGLSTEGNDWKTLSEQAFGLVYGQEEGGVLSGEPRIAPAFTAEVEVGEDGSLTSAEEFTGMELGLYLVAADSARSPRYEYSFTPMVVSLPWSEYQYVGGEASDEWQYDRDVILKPARTPLYGDVRILKTLESYNASQGEVTFVFDVTAADPETGEMVYSNVVSASFSGVGTREIILENLPAEALVTVTEVYSGANCQVTASDEGPKAVIAGEMGEGTEPVTFRFTNAYDEEAKSGYGVENRFRYDTEAETYVWTTDRDDINAE